MPHAQAIDVFQNEEDITNPLVKALNEGVVPVCVGNFRFQDNCQPPLVDCYMSLKW